MSTAVVKTRVKRPSKGMRKHNRKMKQEARKAAFPGTVIKKKKRIVPKV